MNTARAPQDAVEAANADTADAPVDGETSDALAGLQEALEEMEDRWRRTLADLDNLRKRVARDREQIREDERARAATEWLPVLDNLDLALSYAPPAPDPFVDGVRAVRDQALAILARLGFPRRDDAGSRFDPRLHEAIGTAPAPEGADEGTVLSVMRPGYGTAEKQLRPATVVVATKRE
ncbi:MAG TPA: nucleotide exchange factor GrpE [Frankiaceae bacterium]|jgi:molecular chaperone GrpE|nr:nucleotide exchange factor GrpE [Frankiaceae bacterium]